MSRTAFAGIDFEPWPDCGLGEKEAVQNFALTLHLAIATLAKTKAETIELVRGLEDNPVDGGVESLAKCMQRAREYARECAKILKAAETRLSIAEHNVYAHNGARRDPQPAPHAGDREHGSAAKPG
jgi:exonuclease VII small subunit